MTTARTMTAVTAALVVAVAGCGGGDDGSQERARTVTTATTAPPEEVEGGGDETLTEAQLQAALLTVTDLPTGYTAAADDGVDDDADDGEPVGTDADCSARFEALGESEGTETASADVDFEGGFGVVLEQSLESYEDEDVLTKRFDDVVDVLSECPSFTTTDDAGATIELTISSLSFPKLGDDTVALAVAGTSGDFDIRLNIALVRLGRNVMNVAQGGLTADAAVLEEVARTGLSKLAAAGKS
jgi:hypothetical protein